MTKRLQGHDNIISVLVALIFALGLFLVLIALMSLFDSVSANTLVDTSAHVAIS